MERIEQIFQDNPDHQAGMTSSIGGLWPPERGSHRRVKAFFDQKITSMDQMRYLGNRFFGNRLHLSELNFHIDKNTPPTRVQFRALVDSIVLRQVAREPLFQNYVEAIIPLDQAGKDENCLIYMGGNSIQRLSSDLDLKVIEKNIQTVVEVQRRSCEEIFSKPQINGYKIEILKQKGFQELRELAVLYERFGWKESEVSEIMQNQNNIFSVARANGQIVSAGIAELASIPINEDSLLIAEITEAATLNGHDGQGLYTAVSAELLVELARMSQQNTLGGNIDVVFGECNGLSTGVLKVAKIQGRTLATDVGRDYGFPKSGILKQQVPINGAERNTQYNDLVPAFLTGSKLIEYYGSI